MGTIQNRQRKEKSQYWKCQRFFQPVSYGNLSVLLVDQTAWLLRVQTRDKHRFPTCFPPASPRGTVIILHRRCSFCESFLKAAK